MRPVVLDANQPDTFYAGSGRLAAFRDAPLPNRPEDWVASTTPRFGTGDSGLSVLPDGTRLLDAVRADPGTWLGRPEPDPGLLVKLLDTGQRLPLHVHPDRHFARAHLSSRHGKTEAWIVLEARPDAYVHLGFDRDIDPEELASWVDEQDVSAMLAATHKVPVRAGDAVLCPAGTPHSISDGILLIELQEPTDFSVLLEQRDFPVPAEDALLRLPTDIALDCVNLSATSLQTLKQLRTPGPGSLLPGDAEPFFRAVAVGDGDGVCGFAVLVVVDGAGALSGDWGDLAVQRGTTVVVPAAAGECGLSGGVRAVACQPPLP